jgi:hypothetical protein
MKKIFWVLALGAVVSAAMAVGLGRAADVQRPTAAAPKAH